MHILLSYVQVAYHGGHVSFAGGKRVLWVYDVTALKTAEDARRLSEQRLVELQAARRAGVGQGRAIALRRSAIMGGVSALRRRRYAYRPGAIVGVFVDGVVNVKHRSRHVVVPELTGLAQAPAAAVY